MNVPVSVGKTDEGPIKLPAMIFRINRIPKLIITTTGLHPRFPFFSSIFKGVYLVLLVNLYSHFSICKMYSGINFDKIEGERIFCIVDVRQLLRCYQRDDVNDEI